MSRSTPRTAAALALILAAASLVTVPLTAQRPDAESLTANTLAYDSAVGGAAATVADVAWLAGHWVGEGLGGVVEDVWMPPRAGRMVGAFTLVREGQVAFHELMVLVEEAGSLALKVKHFDADLTAWEDRETVVSFPLVRLDPDAAWFEGLTIRRLGPSAIRVYLAIESSRTGEVREEVFEYERRPEI